MAVTVLNPKPYWSFGCQIPPLVASFSGSLLDRAPLVPRFELPRLEIPAALPSREGDLRTRLGAGSFGCPSSTDCAVDLIIALAGMGIIALEA